VSRWKEKGGGGEDNQRREEKGCYLNKSQFSKTGRWRRAIRGEEKKGCYLGGKKKKKKKKTWGDLILGKKGLNLSRRAASQEVMWSP